MTIFSGMTSYSPTTIKALRVEKDLSQEAFARMVGVSVRTIARWEGGLSQPSSLAIARLMEAVTDRKKELDSNGPY